jgi:predicted MFS family arabinose efflux permease
MSNDHHSPSETGFRGLLKNQAFLLLWLGQLLSQVADKVFFVLLTTDLLELYQTNLDFKNSTRSSLMIASTIPAILFGSVAGIIVDWFPKKPLMVLSDVIRAVFILLIPLLPKYFFILWIFTFLLSSITQVFAPAEQSAIPLLVKRENLMTANALFTTTMMGSLIIGFAIGEPLLTFAKNIGGQSSQEIFVAILYFGAAIFGQLIKIKEPQNQRGNFKFDPWGEMKLGLKYLWEHKQIKRAMLQLIILYCVFAGLTVLAIPLAGEIGLLERQFGFLLAAAGVGLVLGAGILGHWGESLQNKPLPLIGFVIMAFVLSLLTFIHSVPLGLGMSMILGVGASLIAVPMQTVIHQNTPEDMRGKMFGFKNNIENIALSVPLAIAGPLTDTIGLRPVLIGISIIVVVIAFWAWEK